MIPRSVTHLRHRTVYHQLRQLSCEPRARRYISQRNLASSQTLLFALRGSLRPNEHLRQADDKHPLHQNLTTTVAGRMASDEDYMAFLDKANQDPNEGYTKPQSSKQEFKTTDDGAKIP